MKSRKLPPARIPECTGGVGVLVGLIWIALTLIGVQSPLNTDQLRWMYAFNGEETRLQRAVEIGILDIAGPVDLESHWVGSKPARILVTPPSGRVGILEVVVVTPTPQRSVVRVSATDPNGYVVESILVYPGQRASLRIPLTTFIDPSPFPKRKLHLLCSPIRDDPASQQDPYQCAKLLDLRWDSRA